MMIFRSGAARQELFQIAEQKVNIQDCARAPHRIMMVSYRINRRSCWISASRIPSVIEGLTSGVFADVVVEVDFIAVMQPPRLVLQLFGNTIGDGQPPGDAAGYGR
ncbi:hypothetical protein MJ579_13350 [Klebsiella pneumoniae]|nr:hypothetical protein MJ579_13350 [Klebsiella pneumoniae]